MASTVDVAGIAPAAEGLAELPERSLWQSAWLRFRRHRLARVGLVSRPSDATPRTAAAR